MHFRHTSKGRGGKGGEGEGEGRGEEGGGKEEERGREGRGGEALAVEPSHFSTGSDATAIITVSADTT